MQLAKKNLSKMSYPLVSPRRMLACAAVIWMTTCLVRAGGMEGGNPVVRIGPADTEKEIIYKAAHLTPTERQIECQEMEFVGFTHNGPNTFTGREWGTGHEDPAIVNPAEFDAEEVARQFKEFGFKMILFIAKHHDGFCMWPTKTTEHCIRNSPWRNGKGDILGDMVKACAKHGLKFGVYLSPWDLNQTHKGAYGTAAYNTVYREQLRELLTNYGPIADVWMDGAGSPPQNQPEIFDWAGHFALIRELQPQATISICGPDVRWVGNEAGDCRESEWSVVPKGYGAMEEDIGSRQKLKAAKELVWLPAQPDTSIRPGWFWHEEENEWVQPLDRLMEIYYNSVGHHSQLLLNVPLDRRGKIHENDIRRMREFRAVLDATFAMDLAAGAKATASDWAGEHTADRIADGNKRTYWTTEDWHEKAEVEFMLPRAVTFNVVMLQEQIRVGQRIEEFAVDAWLEGQWKEIGRATTIGYKKLLRVKETTTDKVRVRILASRVCPTLSNFGLFYQPVILTGPTIRRNQEHQIRMEGMDGAEIRYTLDGSEPNTKSELYCEPFEFPFGGVIRAKSFAKRSDKSFAYGDPSTRAEFGLSRAKWSIVSADGNYNETKKGWPKYAIDGNPETIWHTNKNEKEKPAVAPSIVIDLGETVEVTGFGFLPRHNAMEGIVNRYEFYVSLDGKSWGEPAAAGRFDNVQNNPIQQTVHLAKGVKGRFVKFVAVAVEKGPPYGAAAEIEVFGKPIPIPPGSAAPGITFFLAADCHVGNSPVINISNIDMIEAMNELPGNPYPEEIGGLVEDPAGVLLAGDLTQDAKASDWDTFVEFYGKDGTDGLLRFPVYETAGNHDHPANFRDSGGREHVVEAIAHRRGGNIYAWDAGPAQVVCAGRYPDAETLFWLKENLASIGPKKPVLLFFHYNLRYRHSNYWCEEERAAFRDAIAGYNIIGIFTGHEHTVRHYEWEGYDVFGLGSPYATPENRAIVVVRISHDRMTAAVWRWESDESRGWMKEFTTIKAIQSR